MGLTEAEIAEPWLSNHSATAPSSSVGLRERWRLNDSGPISTAFTAVANPMRSTTRRSVPTE